MRVNAEILANSATQARVMGIEDAQKTGAMMLFGEKYGDEVRVLDIGNSRELCGGTHVARTGDIGLFKIVSESGVAAGIRRVEAVTGDNALAYVQTREHEIRQAAAALKAQPAELGAKLTQMLDNVRTLEKELDRLKSKLAASAGDELVQQAMDVSGVRVLAAQLDGLDAKGLRETADKLRDKLKSCALVLGTVADGKVSLIAAVTPDVTGQHQGRRTGEFRRHPGRRQGRRQAGPGDGGRQRANPAAGRPGVGAGLGAEQTGVNERVQNLLNRP